MPYKDIDYHKFAENNEIHQKLYSKGPIVARAYTERKYSSSSNSIATHDRTTCDRTTND